MAKETQQVEPEKILGLDDGQPKNLLGAVRRGRPDHGGAAKLLNQLLGERRPTT